MKKPFLPWCGMAVSLLLLIGCANTQETGTQATEANGPNSLPATENGQEEGPGFEEDSYAPIYADSFENYTIVLKPETGFVALDKQGVEMYQVFLYDNGPDYPSEGYFRIVEGQYIGYADFETGAVMIAPKYKAARPFENGYAAVCPDCETIKDGEYSRWANGKWGLIDKMGRMAITPQYDEISTIGADGRALVVDDGQEKWIEIK